MTTLICPRHHGALSRIALHSDIDTQQFAYLCSFCGGIHIDSQQWHHVLPLEPSLSKQDLHNTRIPFPCENCSAPKKIILVNELPIFYCVQCGSYWMDSGIFPLLLWHEAEKQTGASPAISPFSPLSLSCCDCGAVITTMAEAHPCPIGLVCQRCFTVPPTFSEQKIHNYQMLTFRGMEVKIEHWSQSVRSLIAITPAQPSLLNVHFHSLTWKERLIRCGRRKIAFAGELGKKIDSDQDIALRTPLAVFLTQRGVAALLKELSNLGSIDIQFRPHNFSFDLKALRVSNEIRLHFEVAVRRMLIAYLRFVELTQLYDLKPFTQA